jgi:HAD superfamily phosphatase
MVRKKLTTIVVFDIDGVIRDVSGSYRRAIADTVEYFTEGKWRPTMEDIDRLKGEGIWNNDWEASRELIYRYFEQAQSSRRNFESRGHQRNSLSFNYDSIVAFFQARYRGTNPDCWDGYITSEPLLVSAEYLEQLTINQIGWGFFSGATRGSAEYILKKRLGLSQPILIAMEDAPGKPDPTGLFTTVEQIEGKEVTPSTPVLYVGDTVADMYTVTKARALKPERSWLGVGVLPPHVSASQQRADYANRLKKAGAAIVLSNVEQLHPSQIQSIINNIGAAESKYKN